MLKQLFDWNGGEPSLRETTRFVKRIAMAALVAHLAVPSVSAEDGSTNVRMTASGTMTATTINLQDNTITDDEDLAGDGTLGVFTFHGLRADARAPAVPAPPATCATPLFFPVVNGAGVFRFDDGSLLVVNITGGGICIDLSAGMAQLTETYEIARGTGRFKSASGTLHLRVTVMPVLFNAEGGAQWLTMTGKFEGTVSGVSRERDR
jgi:hypothetical protein